VWLFCLTSLSPLYFPQHVLMKFSSKLSREDNQALLRAGIILVAGL
jgi:hypothetical protein